MLEEQCKTKLGVQKEACEGLLKELDKHLEAYQGLGRHASGVRSTMKRQLDKLKWTQANVDRYRQRLISSVNLLNAISMDISKSVQSHTYIIKYDPWCYHTILTNSACHEDGGSGYF